MRAHVASIHRIRRRGYPTQRAEATRRHRQRIVEFVNLFQVDIIVMLVVQAVLVHRVTGAHLLVTVKAYERRGVDQSNRVQLRCCKFLLLDQTYK